MSREKQIELRIEYWKDRKSDFLILLDNWLRHEKKTLTLSSDILYDEYLSRGIKTSKLSEYKYGKDLQIWFDNYIHSSKHSKLLTHNP